MSQQEKHSVVGEVQLREHELEQFMDLCGLEVNLHGGDKTDTVLARYLRSMRVYSGGPRNPYADDIIIDNILHDEATRFMFETYYPEATDEDLRGIVAIDANTFARVDRFTFMDSSRVRDQWELDQAQKEFQDFVGGTDSELPTYRYRGISANDPNVSPAVASRIREGLPRPLQLVLAAKVPADLSDEREDLAYNIPVFQNVVDNFNLSDAELTIMLNMARSHGASSARYVTHHLLSNRDMLERVIAIASDSVQNRVENGSEEHGIVIEELLGGAETITAALKSAFSHAPEHWDMVADNLSSERVETYLPFEKRRAMVLERMQQYPRIPSEREQEYISLDEVAQIAYGKILESLAGELPEYGWGRNRTNYTKVHAAVEFGVDDAPFRLQKLEQHYPKLVTLLEATAAEESELGIAAQAWRNRIKRIDSWLDEQFELYVREKWNHDLDPLPVDGWCGDPSEQDIIDAHFESRKKSLDAMAKIKAEVEEHLAQTRTHKALRK